MEEKNENIITLNDVDYTLKVGMKAIVVFEALTDKPFEIKTQTDLLAYVYASIIAGTPNTKLGFDEMLEAFDENPEALRKALEIAVPRTAVEKLVQQKNEGGNAPKKD